MRGAFFLFLLAASLASWADDNAPSALGGATDATQRVGDDCIERNYIVNGGFDDAAFEQRELNGYDGMDLTYECTSLPGWAIETAGLRNGIIEIVPHENADFNARYVRFRHYTLDGWARIKLTATVGGLVPGHSYMFDMYVSHSYLDSNYWANPDHGFKIYGKDGRLLHFNHAISSGDEWQYLRYEVVPSDDVITIELWSQNYNGDGNKSGVHTVSWDQLRLYDPEACGIPSISRDRAIQIYTLQGILVNSASPLRGVYLVKSGEGVAKVVY